MCEVRVASAARVVRLSLEPGEELVRTLIAAVDDLDIATATVTLRGHFERASLVLGRRIFSRATVDPDRVSFDDGRTLVGNGEIGTGPDGRTVALTAVVGRQREVVVAEVVEAVVGEHAEVVIHEVP